MMASGVPRLTVLLPAVTRVVPAVFDVVVMGERSASVPVHPPTLSSTGGSWASVAVRCCPYRRATELLAKRYPSHAAVIREHPQRGIDYDRDGQQILWTRSGMSCAVVLSSWRTVETCRGDRALLNLANGDGIRDRPGHRYRGRPR